MVVPSLAKDEALPRLCRLQNYLQQLRRPPVRCLQRHGSHPKVQAVTDEQAKQLGLQRALKMTPVHRRRLHGDTSDFFDAIHQAYLMIRDMMAQSPPPETIFPMDLRIGSPSPSLRWSVADEERRRARLASIDWTDTHDRRTG